MNVIGLPCYDIAIRLGIDEGDSPEAQHAKEIGVDASITSEFGEANIRQGDVFWQDSYVQELHGLESLILQHARAGVDVADPKYIRGIQEAVQDIKALYRLGAECYGANGELLEDAPLTCKDYTTARDVANKLMIEEKKFTFHFDADTGNYVIEVIPE